MEAELLTSETIGFLPAASPVEGAYCCVFGNDSRTYLVAQPQVADDIFAAYPDSDNVAIEQRSPAIGSSYRSWQLNQAVEPGLECGRHR